MTGTKKPAPTLVTWDAGKVEEHLQDTPDSPEWTAAKSRGDRAELRVAEWFKAQGFAAFKSLGHAQADLLVQFNIEVKADLLAGHTGNVAVEVSYKGRPSGIRTSTARCWAIVVGSECFLVETVTLREFITGSHHREVPAGDGKQARVRLVPIQELRALPGVRVVELGGGAA